MSKKLLAILLVAVPLSVSARTIGFAGVTLWYGKEPVFAGGTVRIYSALLNSGDGDLTGTVQFFDNDVLIGKVPVTVPAGGRIRDVWIDWIPTYGEHRVLAKLVDAKIQPIGKDPVPIEPNYAVTGTDTRFFDYDTDNDGVGDREDSDDDADGVSDTVEKAAGTDPRNAKEVPTRQSQASAGVLPEGSSVSNQGSLKQVGEVLGASVSRISAAVGERDGKAVFNAAKDSVVATDGELDVWRTAQHLQIAQALAEVREQQEDEGARTPLGYFKLAGLWVLEKVLSSRIFFYGTAIGILLLAIRLLLRRRNRIYY